jgi:RNA polymerase sigma-70 factor, ECF subfamily
MRHWAAQPSSAGHLVEMEGYSVEEAVQILTCAPGTVKSPCARSQARLLPLLSNLRAEEGFSSAPSARAVL